jgi:hypothetical protein
LVIGHWSLAKAEGQMTNDELLFYQNLMISGEFSNLKEIVS